MNPLTARYREVQAQVREAFARLNPREQMFLLGGIGAFVVLVMFLVGFGVSSMIGAAERRVKLKTEQLAEVQRLQGDYRAREAEHNARVAEIRRSKTRLVSIVEEAARQAGIEIGQLSPEEKEPNADGVVESLVNLRAADLSIDRLQDFLSRLEKSPGVVIVQLLEIKKPYRKDTLTVDMTVLTYRMKS